MHESRLSFSVSHWTVVCNRGTLNTCSRMFTFNHHSSRDETEDRGCTKLAECGHSVDQVQTVVRVFLDHRIEPQVQFLQILQLVQREDVLQRRQSVIVQIQSLQRLQVLDPLQASAPQTHNTRDLQMYNYTYSVICILSKTYTHCVMCIVWVMLIN